MASNPLHPRVGMLATVRNRRGLIVSVEDFGGEQGAQAGEELVGVHVGVGGAAAPGRLEGDAHAAAGERSDGVVGEGRAQEVAADSLELLAVADSLI